MPLPCLSVRLTMLQFKLAPLLLSGVFSEIGGQHFDNRPMKFVGVQSDLLQCVSRSDTNIQIVDPDLTELLDSFCKTLGHLAATLQLKYRSVAVCFRAVLPACFPKVEDPDDRSQRNHDSAEQCHQGTAKVVLGLKSRFGRQPACIQEVRRQDDCPHEQQ